MKKAIFGLGVVASVGVLVSALGTGGVWPWSPPAAEASQAHLGPLAEARAEADNPFTASLPSTSARQVLRSSASVAMDAPVAKVYSTLRSAALAGDTVAACRIVAGLQKCFEANLNLETASNISRQTPNPENQQAAAGLLRSYEMSAEGCQDVSAKMMSEAYRFQAIAANSGRPELKRWLATKPALDSRKFVEELDQWKDYQRRAETYFDGALRSRSGSDLGPLILVHAPSDAAAPRPPFKRPDVPLFLALVEIATRKGQALPAGIRTAAEDLQGSLTPEQSIELQERRFTLSSGWDSAQPHDFPYQSLLLPEATVCK